MHLSADRINLYAHESPIQMAVSSAETAKANVEIMRAINIFIRLPKVLISCWNRGAHRFQPTTLFTLLAVEVIEVHVGVIAP